MTNLIGQNLKAARLNKGMTQVQLAEALFVTRQTVSNWENNRSEPDLEMLGRMAELLDVEFSSILGQEVPLAQAEPSPEETVQEEVVQPSPAGRFNWRYVIAAAVLVVLLAIGMILRAGGSAVSYTPEWFQAPAAAAASDQALLEIYIRPNNSEVTLPDENGGKTWPFALLMREKNGIGAQVELIRIVPFFADGSHEYVDYDKDLLATKTQSSHIDRFGVMRLFVVLSENDAPLTGVGFCISITDDKNHQEEFRYYASPEQLQSK